MPGHVLNEDLNDDEDLERERKALSVRFNMLARRKLDTLPFDEEEGKRLTIVLKKNIALMETMSPETIKEKAMFAHFALKNKENMMSQGDNRITDFYGHYFNKEDGEELFRALEKFYEYNNGKHTAAEVVDMIMNAVLKPYLKIKNTGVDTTVSTVSEVFEPAVLEAQYPVTATQYPITPNQYPVTATQYPITSNQYPATATQYLLTATQYHVTASQYPVPSWRHNMNLKQNVRRVLYPKLLKKIKEHYKIDNNKSHNLLCPKLDENCLKNRNRQLDEQEQTKQKAYIASEKVNNYPKYFQDIVKNYMSHKIREVPSYNDEEEHIRTNLYDALRHGNMTLVSFRKSGGDVISNHPLRDLSSEPDDEWVLKNNIYKFFGQK